MRSIIITIWILINILVPGCNSGDPMLSNVVFELKRGGSIQITGNGARLIASELSKYYNQKMCQLLVDTSIAFNPNYDGSDFLPPLVGADSDSNKNSLLPFGLVRYDHPNNYSERFIELNINIIYHMNRNLKGIDQLNYDYLELVFALNMELNEVLSYGANSIGLPDTFPVKTDMFPGVGGQSK